MGSDRVNGGNPVKHVLDIVAAIENELALLEETSLLMEDRNLERIKFLIQDLKREIELNNPRS